MFSIFSWGNTPPPKTKEKPLHQYQVLLRAMLRDPEKYWLVSDFQKNPNFIGYSASTLMSYGARIGILESVPLYYKDRSGYRIRLERMQIAGKMLRGEIPFTKNYHDDE